MTKGTFVVSLDFELEWGVRDRPGAVAYRPNLLGSRRAIPRILDLFREFDIHATWATVGFLFFSTREELLASLPARRPKYNQPRLNPYLVLDSVGRGEDDDPLHFAPSLICRILSEPGQEIGTHTFSHFYCLEPGQTPDDFREDLRAAQDVARRVGVELRSLVFPRNQLSPAYLDVCREVGLESYRGNESSWAYAERSRADDSSLRRTVRLLDSYVNLTGAHCSRIAECVSPVNIPSSRFLRPYSPTLKPFEQQRLRRITLALEAATAAGSVFHLWWHPHNFGLHTDENLAFLRQILERVAALREQGRMESRNMAEVAAEVRHAVAAGVA